MKSSLILAIAAFALVSWGLKPANERRAEKVVASISQSGSSSARASAGRAVFLKNCAHCHAADAHGNEGPDLHNLDLTDEQIATRIRNGKKGEMTAFAGKLSQKEIKEVIAWLRTLK